MSELPPVHAMQLPGVRALVPLLYTAWADRILTPSEAAALRRQAGTLAFLTDTEREILRQWSDPARPPGRDLFKWWEIEMQAAVAALPAAQQPTLTAIGLAMAATAKTKAGLPVWSADPVVEAQLAELEIALRQLTQKLYPGSGAAHPEEGMDWEVADLRAYLDGAYAGLRERMRTVLVDPAFTRYVADTRLKEDYRERVLHWCRLLAGQGLGALSYPAAYGGQDSMADYATVFEMLAYHDLSLAVKFGVQFGLWGGSILGLGTEKHHQRYLTDTGNLTLAGCFAMTETGHGSNVRGLETTATYDPAAEEWVVHTPREEAGKEYIGNALHGQVAAVFVQLITAGENHGVHAVVVPLRDEEGQLRPGVRIEDNGYKLGLNGVDNGRIWFDQVRVPRENLLDRFAQVTPDGGYHSPIADSSRRFFTMLGTLVGGRVCVPRAALSATKSALAIAVRYALRRRQFAPGPTEPEVLLLDYPVHQRRLLPRLATTYALHFALDDLLAQFVAVQKAGHDLREIETRAAALKAYTTWFATDTIQECREACGGKGYLVENRLADLKADTDIFTTFEGDNTVLMQLVAKGVLTAFQKEFYEEGNRAVLRHLGERLGTAIMAQNPITFRNTDLAHLRDHEFLLTAFRFRERRLLLSVGNRLRGLIKAGESAHEASLICQTHLLALAGAYAERLVLESFVARSTQAPAGEIASRLATLCSLYGLTILEKHGGWYLEQEFMAAAKSKAVRRSVDALCAELRPSAGMLVEAFAIPDELLGAPIVR